MSKSKDYEFHPYSEHFELVTDEDKTAMVADIKDNGLLDPITLYEGQILDGRNREICCKEAGVEPRYVEFEGTSEEALALVRSRNLHRRHSNTQQRAFAAAKLAGLAQGQRKDLKEKAVKEEAVDDGNGTPDTIPLPKTQVEAAEAMGVSTRDLQRAALIDKKGSTGLQEAVKRDEVSLSDAAAIASLPKIEQNEALKNVRAGKARTLREAAGVQVQTGAKKSKSKPPKTTGAAFKNAHKAVGALTREIDRVANTIGVSANAAHPRSIRALLKKIKDELSGWQKHHQQKQRQSA